MTSESLVLKVVKIFVRSLLDGPYFTVIVRLQNCFWVQLNNVCCGIKSLLQKATFMVSQFEEPTSQKHQETTITMTITITITIKQ